MAFWYARPVGWMVRRKKSVEKSVEFASAYETDVSNLDGAAQPRWTWLPQGMTVCRILDCKLSTTKDIVVSH